jgi:hypothetical protein
MVVAIALAVTNLLYLVLAPSWPTSARPEEPAPDQCKR